ncbi:MAG: hypothetical protein K0S60_36 [Evtepia sp.]|jgi:predicted secreted protein|nr:hypothetical protein [Evtepia sp.]
MDCCNLPIAISVAACAIANQVQDNADLVLLATVLSQLSSTLGTIAAQRDLCKEKADTNEKAVTEVVPP